MVIKKVVKRSKKFVKKAPSAMAKGMNALSTVSMHHNKLLSSLFDSVYFETKAMREQELNFMTTTATPGFIPISLNTTDSGNKIFPLHLIDLTQITDQDGSSTGSAMYCLKTGITDQPFFATISEFPAITPVGGNDGTSYTSAQNLNRTLFAHYDCRLDLFPRNQYNTEYTLTLLKLNDETLAPLINGSSILEGSAKHNVFWKHMARPYYTNTLAPSSHRQIADMKDGYKVLWEKTYKIGEKKNDVESFVPRRVKLFKQVNKVLRYNENPVMPVTTTDNPNSYYTSVTTGSSSVRTRIKDRLYLMIRANATIDQFATGMDTTGVAAADIPSYNFYLRTKHTVPQLGV